MRAEQKRPAVPQGPNPSRGLTAILALAALLLLSACTVRHVNTSNALRYFPVGASPAAAETAWRIDWAFEPHPTKPGEEIWVITGVDFMRGHKTVSGQQVEDWVHVLDRLTVGAMFVPYVESSSRFRDFAAYYTGQAQLDGNAATGRAYKPTFIHQDRVVRETTDDFVRWSENGAGGYHSVARLRRGQAMTLWSQFSAVNYVYPVAYKFRDDGVIQVRIAASGQNLRSGPTKANAHLHMGAWRLEPHLCLAGNAGCNAADVVVETVSRRVVGPQEEIVVAPFNGDVEGGEPWRGDEFTALLMTNPNQPNGRPVPCNGQPPPCTSQLPIGYALIPVRYGLARYQANSSEGFLANELWVTRKPVPPALAQTLFVEIETYVDGESLAGGRKVVWHKSAFNHIPRYEDLGFGSGNSFSNAKGDGVALTTFTGFDLVPRNLMFDTPFYPP